MIKQSGFTLAELLISLAILGVIATFTIPKVLNGQQDVKYNSMAKEVAGTISQAYMEHKLAGQLSSSTGMDDFLPYLNYVALKTTGSLNWEIGQPAALDCSNGIYTCVRLHNNGALWWHNGCFFNGTTNLNILFFRFDPDGQFLNNITSPETSTVNFIIYYNGLLRTRASAQVGSTSNCGAIGPAPIDPPWFSWS